MNDDKKIMQYITRSMNNMNVHLPTSSPRTSNNKGSESTSKPPAFQFISHDELLSLFEQRKGSQYFIPEGFEPVLIPRGSPLQPVANLLQNGKNLHQQLLIHQKQQQLKNQNAATPDVVVVNNNTNNNNNNLKIKSSPIISNNQLSQNTSSDVRFPQLVLARSTAPTPQRGSVAKAQKPKKPPRPPNAFILYRRSKQPDIVAQNEGISNNEVSKQVGEMWHKEPIEEKMKFQRLADAAKMEHMKKYPEYKYRPRRPHEKRRRTKRPNSSLNNNNNNNNNNNVNKPDDDIMITTTTSPILSNDDSPLISTDNDLSSFLQQQQQPQQTERRSSIESNSSSNVDLFDESRRSSLISCSEINEIDYDYSLYDDSSLVDEPSQIQYPVTTTSSCITSNSHEFNVHCDNPFDLMMDSVSPGNDSDVNQFDLFGFGYSGYPMQFNNTFDYSLVSNDQMMSCNIDA